MNFGSGSSGEYKCTMTRKAKKPVHVRKYTLPTCNFLVRWSSLERTVVLIFALCACHSCVGFSKEIFFAYLGDIMLVHFLKACPTFALKLHRFCLKQLCVSELPLPFYDFLGVQLIHKEQHKTCEWFARMRFVRSVCCIGRNLASNDCLRAMLCTRAGVSMHAKLIAKS